MSAIAILGASSQIAKDLIRSFVKEGRTKILLYVRNLNAAKVWVGASGLSSACSVHTLDEYGELPHDVVINFIGVGDPCRAAEMGANIFNITHYFDELVLVNLARNPKRRYFFLSSGAVYGNSFAEPVTKDSEARFAINQIAPQEYYAVAKLLAELGHRSRPDLAIVDLRIFNYFSRTQDLDARFLITDIVRAIRDGQILKTSNDHIVRDYLHPDDFHRLITCILAAPPVNCAVDCYSRDTIDKNSILRAMQKEFDLKFESNHSLEKVSVNATGNKIYYYSLNRKAAEFDYLPFYSSLECLLTETAAILNRVAHKNT